MKKRLLLQVLTMALALVAGMGSAAAQGRVKLGLRAGLTSGDLKFAKEDFKEAVFATDTKFGFHAAVVSRIRILGAGGRAAGVGLFLQPEVVYSSSNFKMQKSGPDEGVSTIRMQSVDIPVLVSLKASIVRLQAGPVFQVLYRNDPRSGSITLTPTTKSPVGYTVGLSIDIWGGLVLDGRFGGQFRKFNTRVVAGEGEANSFSVRSSLSSWSLGVSWMF